MYQFNQSQSLNHFTTLSEQPLEISADPARKSLSVLWRCSLLLIKVCFILFCLLDNAEIFAQVIVINPVPFIKAPSTTTISSSANPSVAGQPVTLTAMVTSPAQSTPTGLVHFYNNTTNTDLTPAGISISNGIASFSTPVLNSNTDFTATYEGDGVNLPSTSTLFTQVVTQPIIIINPIFNTTTTTLVSDVNPSVAGSQPVTFTASVSSSNQFIVDGLVDFYDNTNGTNLTPAGVVLSNGIATFTTSSLPFGDLNITATYRGNADFQPSYSNSVIQHVQLTISGISVTLISNLDNTTFSTAGNSFWGDRVSFIATVSTGIGSAGTVTFTDNGFLLGSANIDGSGKATLTTNLLTPGDHSITASYFSITSSVLTHNVTAPFKTTLLPTGGGFAGSHLGIISNSGYNVISQNERRYFFGPLQPYGKPITFGIFASGATRDIPTGSVIIKLIHNDVSNFLGEVALDAGGNAFFTTSILPIGNGQFSLDTIVALYVGNDVYLPKSDTVRVAIGASPTTTTLSSRLNPSIAGQQVTFTASVASPFPGSNALAPGGTVIFNIDGVDQPPAPLSGNGVKAFLDISSLSPGSHTIKATYLADGNYNGSASGSIKQVVENVGTGIFNYIGDAQTTLVNTAFPNPLQFDILDINPKLVDGASVTFTAPSNGASGTFSNGTNSVTVKTTKSGSSGNANSGPFTANNVAGTYTVTASIPGFGTNTFTMTNTAPPVQITIGTSVPGLSFSVDGFTFTATKTFSWEPGSSHTLATSSPQSLIAATQYGFTVWSDGTNTLSYTIIVPSNPTSYIANFQCLIAQEWVLNKDLDNYYVGDPIFACQSPGSGYVPKGDLKPGDCDDNNDAIIPQVWLLDADRDGYHDKIYFALPSCAPPQDGRNYINNSKGLDCDDSDPSYNPETVWVIDADGDGYYTDEPYTGCLPLFATGYVRKINQQPGDCNDNDKAINPGTVWYKDADNDSYSDGTVLTQCLQPIHYKLATELTAITGDCNDDDPAINPETLPVITGLPSNISVNNDAGVCGAKVTWAQPGVVVDCTNSSIRQTAGPANGSAFIVGITTIIYEASNAYGKITTSSFIITVKDNEPPVITCPTPAAAYATDAGQCTKTLSLPLTAATDNCGTPQVAYYINGNGISFPYNFPFGITTVTATATDVNGLKSSCSYQVNVNKITTTVMVTVTPTQQYSDKVTFKATVAPANCGAAGTTGGTVSFLIGTQVMGTRPVISGVAILDTVLLEPLPIGTLPLGQLAPGVKSVTAQFSGTSTNYLINDPTTTFTITEENAIADYTGQDFASTGTATATSSLVRLSATIRDTTSVNPVGDPYPGVIINAKGRFVIRGLSPTNPGSVLVPEFKTSWLPVQLLGTDTKIGAILLDTTLSIPGNNNAVLFEVKVEVDSFYTNEVLPLGGLTLSKSLSDFLTFGGNIRMTPNSSAGLYPSNANSRVNFGGTAKWNKKGSNLQGGVNISWRSGSNVYQLKGIIGGTNGSLSVNITNPAVQRAVINAKANITDAITGLTAPNTSNSIVTINLRDRGEPGSTDSISIDIRNGNGLLIYSSNWTGITTLERKLAGGNIQISSATTTTSVARAVQPIVNNSLQTFDVKVLGNPTSSSFRLKIESSNARQQLTIKIVDANGTLMQVKENVYAGQLIEFGKEYTPGIYFVEVLQGEERKLVKLIKILR